MKQVLAAGGPTRFLATVKETRHSAHVRVYDSTIQQSVVKIRRRTEGGDAPGWQGATSENTGSI
jgi:hypothetical protein